MCRGEPNTHAVADRASQACVRREVEGGEGSRTKRLQRPKSIFPSVNFFFSNYRIWVRGRGGGPVGPNQYARWYFWLCAIVQDLDRKLYRLSVPTQFLLHESGTRVPLHTSAAYAKWRPLHYQHWQPYFESFLDCEELEGALHHRCEDFLLL